MKKFGGEDLAAQFAEEFGALQIELDDSLSVTKAIFKDVEGSVFVRPLKFRACHPQTASTAGHLATNPIDKPL